MDDDRARLRPLGPLHLDEPHLRTLGQPVERLIGDRVPVEVDLLAVLRGDEAISLVGEQPGHRPGTLLGPALHVPPDRAAVVLQLAAGRVEDGVDRLPEARLGLAVHRHVASRNRHAEAHRPCHRLATHGIAVGHLDRDPAGHDAGKELLQPVDRLLEVLLLLRSEFRSTGTHLDWGLH